MKQIVEAIRKFKARNGAEVTFTTKELFMAIWEKLDSHEKKIAYNKATLTVLSILVAGICLKLII